MSEPFISPNAQDLSERFCRHAVSQGYSVAERSDLVSGKFAGDVEVPMDRRPKGCIGFQIDRYPVIFGEIDIDQIVTRVQDVLRLFKNQALIARSYLTSSEVIDLQLVLVASRPASDDGDWVASHDSIIRDEEVCRKHVWIRPSADEGTSFNEFIERTFLAKPWLEASQRNAGELDKNARLVVNALITAGLTEESAKTWIEVVSNREKLPSEVVDDLVRAMVTKG